MLYSSVHYSPRWTFWPLCATGSICFTHVWVSWWGYARLQHEELKYLLTSGFQPSNHASVRAAYKFSVWTNMSNIVSVSSICVRPWGSIKNLWSRSYIPGADSKICIDMIEQAWGTWWWVHLKHKRWRKIRLFWAKLNKVTGVIPQWTDGWGLAKHTNTSLYAAGFIQCPTTCMWRAVYWCRWLQLHKGILNPVSNKLLCCLVSLAACCVFVLQMPEASKGLHHVKSIVHVLCWSCVGIASSFLPADPISQHILG